MQRITRNVLEIKLEDDEADLEMVNRYLSGLQKMMENAKTSDEADKILLYIYKGEGLKDAIIKEDEAIKKVLEKGLCKDAMDSKLRGREMKRVSRKDLKGKLKNEYEQLAIKNNVCKGLLRDLEKERSGEKKKIIRNLIPEFHDARKQTMKQINEIELVLSKQLQDEVIIEK